MNDEERQQYAKAYYLANRERLLVQQRAYYEAHKDYYRDQFHDHYVRNKTALRAKAKDRYDANPEPTREQSRQWRKNNQDRVLIQNTRRGDQEQVARLASPWKGLIHAARSRAEKKNLPFSLTDEWGEERWTGRCEVTGLPFSLGKRQSGPKFFSPSIDRIVAPTGYLPENCRFVLWAVNSFKHDASDDDMLFVACAIIDGLMRR